MKNNFKFITVIMVILCIFCGSVTAFAEPVEEQNFDKPEVVETQKKPEKTTEKKPEKTTEKETEKKPEKTTAQTTEKTTEKKPEKTTAKETTEPKTTKPHTTQESTTKKPQQETEKTTERETEKKTEPATEEKITKPAEEKPVDVTTTRAPEQTETTTRRPEEENRDEEEHDEEESETTTEEESLPEGSFYVYLERNNGMPRLKAILTKPELVTEPSVPVRDGFIFDGWYGDPKFTKKWDFYKDFAQEGTVIYAKWVVDPSTTVFNITVKAAKGGSIEVNPGKASPGEPVTITIKPEEGKRLVAGSLTINGKKSDILNFTMPAKNVVITAKFEDIPIMAEEEEEKSYAPFIIGGVILVLIIAGVVFYVVSHRDDFDEDEIDENGTVIDTDNDMSWVDESIVVEDGFKNGEKVVGNFTPEDDSVDSYDDNDD